MTNALVLLWLAALVLMGSPGPATMSLAAVGTAYGLRQGVPYLFGIMAGTTAVLLMIASGVTALILAEPALVHALTIIAAMYIFYLAWKIATAPVGATETGRRQAPTFVPGFALAIANPKAFAAIGAVYAGHTLVGDDLLLDTIAKVLAVCVVIVVVNTAWLVFGATFSRFLTDPVIGRAANICFALALIASVGLSLFSLA